MGRIAEGLSLLIVTISQISCGGKADKIDTYNFNGHKKTDPQVNNRCHHELLRAYQLEADANTLGERNPYCPDLKNNCCGARSQSNSMKMWNESRRSQEYHYGLVLNVYKYVLGYGAQYENIARAIIKDYDNRMKNGNDASKASPSDSQKVPDEAANFGINGKIEANAFCHDEAKAFIDNNNYRKAVQAEIFYKKMTDRVEFLDNTRRSFFCLLCSPDATDEMFTPNKVVNFFREKRINYDMSFCKKMYEHSFQSIYQTYKGFNKFLEHLMKFLLCVKPADKTTTSPQDTKGGEIGMEFMREDFTSFNLQFAPDEKPHKRFSKDFEKFIENPLNLDSSISLESCDGSRVDDLFFGFKCVGFCDHYRIARPSSLFDGDHESLKRVYKYLHSFEFAVFNPAESFFSDDRNKLRSLIDTYIKGDFLDKDFYLSGEDHLRISEFKSDFKVVTTGLDPLKFCEKCEYHFEYESANIMKVAAFLLLSVIVLTF